MLILDHYTFLSDSSNWLKQNRSRVTVESLKKFREKEGEDWPSASRDMGWVADEIKRERGLTLGKKNLDIKNKLAIVSKKEIDVESNLGVKSKLPCVNKFPNGYAYLSDFDKTNIHNHTSNISVALLWTMPNIQNLRLRYKVHGISSMCF